MRIVQHSIVISSLVLLLAAPLLARQPAAAATTQPEISTASAEPAPGGSPRQPTAAADAPDASAPRAADQVEPTANTESNEQPVESHSIEQLESELSDVQQRITLAQDAVTPERAAELGVDQDELAKRLASLEDLASVIQRRITTLTRLNELRQSVAGIESKIENFKQVGLEAEPPYELSLLDGLRDDLTTALAELKDAQASFKTMEDAATHAKQRLAEAATKRRQFRDDLEKAENEAKKAELQWKLSLAELSEQIAAHESAHVGSQLDLARLEVRSRELESQLLKSQIAGVEKQVAFTRRELNEKLDGLDQSREALETRLRILRLHNQTNQVLLEDARAALDEARGEDQIRQKTKTLTSREAVAQASSRGVELLEKRINDVAKFKTLWERRLALTNRPSEEDLAVWDKETADALEEIGHRRGEVERRLQTLRQTKLDIQNREAADPAGQTDKADAAPALRALESLEELEVDYLASLISLQRLAQRVADDIAKQRELNSWWKYWSRLAYRSRELWSRELFVIDDRAFRLGALVQAAVLFLLTAVIAWMARRVIRLTVLRRLQDQDEDSMTLAGESLLVAARKTSRLFVVVIAAYFAVVTLPLSASLRSACNSIAIIALTTQAAMWANAAVKSVVERTKRRRVQNDPSAASAFGLIGFFSRVAVWSAALLLVLSNLGYEIGPLLAGLGVGGVAVAFALQSILGDIFCSIAIVLDKPFVIGDYITVNDLMGTVENIGIKTTRIRSVDGEQIIFPNADLVGSRIRNYKRMFERRILFTFGIVYETPLEQLQQVPQIVRSIIEGIRRTRLDRVHFKAFGESSLNFEVVYYVLSQEYNLSMDIQQEINLALFQQFSERGIAFAYPTREIILRPGNAAKAVFEPPAAPAQTSGPSEQD